MFCDGLYFSALEVNISNDGILSIVKTTPGTNDYSPVFIVRYLETGKFALATGFLMSKIVTILTEKYKLLKNVKVEKANIYLLAIASPRHLGQSISSVENPDEKRAKTKRLMRLIKTADTRAANSIVGVIGCVLFNTKDVAMVSEVTWPGSWFGKQFRCDVLAQMIGPLTDPQNLNANSVPLLVSDIPEKCHSRAELTLSCCESWNNFDGNVLSLQNQFQVVSSINSHITSTAYGNVVIQHRRSSKKVVSGSTQRLSGDPRSALFQLMVQTGSLTLSTDLIDVEVGSKSYQNSHALQTWGRPFADLVCAAVSECVTDKLQSAFKYPFKESSKMRRPSLEPTIAVKRKEPDVVVSLQEQVSMAARTLPISTAARNVDLSGSCHQIIHIIQLWCTPCLWDVIIPQNNMMMYGKCFTAAGMFPDPVDDDCILCFESLPHDTSSAQPIAAIAADADLVPFVLGSKIVMNHLVMFQSDAGCSHLRHNIWTSANKPQYVTLVLNDTDMYSSKSLAIPMVPNPTQTHTYARAVAHFVQTLG